MSTRMKLIDNAVILDDLIHDCGLPEEGWLEKAEVVEDLDEADNLRVSMINRLGEIYDPLPTFELLIEIDSEQPQVGRIRVKGASPKMAMRLAIMGLENSNIPYKKVHVVS